MNQRIIITATFLFLLIFSLISTFADNKNLIEPDSTKWTIINAQAEWSARAGLQAVDLNGKLIIMGGRTPKPLTFPPIPGDSDIWNDVWQSEDYGVSWTKILDNDNTGGHWPARAYYQALIKDESIYIVGGQDYNVIPNPDCPPGDTTCAPFISFSNFYDDVWKSSDGITWELLTDSAGWSGRAGLSAVVYRDEIYVMAGSFNDDPAVIGGPPVRVYFNDVWKSSDGQDWTQMTDNAPWKPRAGAVVVVKDDYMYLIGGEEGFTCIPGGPCPPYFNDVWRSQDGVNWELITDSAAWASRPGHQCVVSDGLFVLWGGFGLSEDPQDPFAFANPMDVWISADGADWKQISYTPWNASSPEDIKYDFDALVLEDVEGDKDWIFTFGGDRETFNFFDPLNYLRIDNDVWRFELTYIGTDIKSEIGNLKVENFALHQNYPNPFNPNTKINYSLSDKSYVSVKVFDMLGREVAALVNQEQPVGNYQLEFNAADLSSGIYFYRIQAGQFVETKKMILMK